MKAIPPAQVLRHTAARITYCIENKNLLEQTHTRVPAVRRPDKYAAAYVAAARVACAAAAAAAAIVLLTLLVPQRLSAFPHSQLQNVAHSAAAYSFKVTISVCSRAGVRESARRRSGGYEGIFTDDKKSPVSLINR